MDARPAAIQAAACVVGRAFRGVVVQPAGAGTSKTIGSVVAVATELASVFHQPMETAGNA